MKKALLCGLSAAMLLALVLVACNKPQADQPTEPDPPPTPSAVQTQPVETPEPEETNEPVNQVEKMSVNTQQEVDTRRLATDEELLKLFNDTYEFGQSFANTGFSEEDVLEQELNQLNFIMGMMADFRAPDDIEVQYLTWRVLNHGTTTPVSAEQQQATNTAENSTATTTTTTQTGSVDVSKLDTGFEADIDPETGDIYYWNPNTTGDLGVDVTGGKSPNDFHMNGWDEEAQKNIEENTYLDMSKVGFGE